VVAPVFFLGSALIMFATPILVVAALMQVPSVMRHERGSSAVITPSAYAAAATFCGGGLVLLSFVPGMGGVAALMGALNLACGVALLAYLERRSRL